MRERGGETSLSPRRGLGRGEGASTARWKRGVVRYGYGQSGVLGAAGNSACTIAESCPLGVRHNVRKSLNFEFLKISNWGGQDIG
jgi:hypothetical protein